MARRSRLVELRERRSLSQEEVAEKAVVHLTTYKRWEDGTVVTLRPKHKRKLAAALNVSLEPTEQDPGIDWYLARDDEIMSVAVSPLPTPVVSESDDDVDRRSFTTATVAVALNLSPMARRLLSGATASVTIDQLELVADAVDECRRQDTAVGGGGVCGVAMVLHERVSHWLNAARPPELREALQGLRVDLGAQVAWLAFDAGKTQLATRYLHETIVDARLIDRPAAEIRAMSCMCLVLNRARRPGEALQCAQAAQRIAAPWATPRLRSLLHLRTAASHAWLGDSAACAKELVEAETQLSHGERDDDLTWNAFLTPHELTGLAGRSHQVLGRPDIAASAYRSIIEDPDPSHPRNVIFYTVQLAQALAQQGDMTQAATVGLEVLPSVNSLQSGRTHNELHQLRSALDSHQSTSPAVYEFAEAYDHT